MKKNNWRIQIWLLVQKRLLFRLKKTKSAPRNLKSNLNLSSLWKMLALRQSQRSTRNQIPINKPVKVNQWTKAIKVVKSKKAKVKQWVQVWVSIRSKLKSWQKQTTQTQAKLPHFKRKIVSQIMKIAALIFWTTYLSEYIHIMMTTPTVEWKFSNHLLR
jgi:hypothetical protein